MKNLKAYQEWQDAKVAADAAEVASNAKYQAFMAGFRSHYNAKRLKLDAEE